MKIQLVLRPRTETTHAGFAALLLDDVLARVESLDPAELKLTYTAERPPRLTVFSFSREPVGVLSVRFADGATANEVEAVVGAIGDRPVDCQAYAVDESVPLEYDRHWPDGETTPGVGLLTLFNRKPGLDDATFLERWHGGHTPFSLEVHPLWCYVRNVVERPLTHDTPPLDGIVEEHFRERRDLLNPVRFFGGPLSMPVNMVKTWLDVRGFIDTRGPKGIETYLVEELIIRSGGGSGGRSDVR